MERAGGVEGAVAAAAPGALRDVEEEGYLEVEVPELPVCVFVFPMIFLCARPRIFEFCDRITYQFSYIFSKSTRKRVLMPRHAGECHAGELSRIRYDFGGNWCGPPVAPRRYGVRTPKTRAFGI